MGGNVWQFNKIIGVSTGMVWEGSQTWFKGTGNTYYSTGDFAGVGTGMSVVPTKGHLVTLAGFPCDVNGDHAEHSGNWWVTIENQYNVVLYSSPAIASGSDLHEKPNTWYPGKSKATVHMDTGGALERYSIEFTIADV